MTTSGLVLLREDPTYGTKVWGIQGDDDLQGLESSYPSKLRESAAVIRRFLQSGAGDDRSGGETDVGVVLDLSHAEICGFPSRGVFESNETNGKGNDRRFPALRELILPALSELSLAGISDNSGRSLRKIVAPGTHQGTSNDVGTAWDGLDSLAECSKLRDVRVSNRVLGALPERIGERWPALETLYVKECAISAPLPASLGLCNSLQALILSGNRSLGGCGDDAVRVLAEERFRVLVALDMDGCGLSEEQLLPVIRNLMVSAPKLKTLHFEGNPGALQHTHSDDVGMTPSLLEALKEGLRWHGVLRSLYFFDGNRYPNNEPMDKVLGKLLSRNELGIAPDEDFPEQSPLVKAAGPR
jgi:hypothetical protein